jgi:hypothetical protein
VTSDVAGPATRHASRSRLARDAYLIGSAAVCFAMAVTSAGVGCVSRPAGDPVGSSRIESPGEPRAGARVEFAYDALDARPVSASAMRGKPTVIAFVTTYDLGSQAQVNYLVAMAKHDADKVNYALVALEKREERELVEVYKTNLGVTFPVALADETTITGGGPLGDVHRIPTVVIFDREGRLVWKKVGLATSDEIRVAMRGR